MKQYLGSSMTAFAAVVTPLFVVLSLLFAGIILFTAEISGATVFLSCMCCGCSVIWFVFIKKEALQLYAWGTFEQTCVRIHSPFTSEIILDYDKCNDMGIGCYTHGVLNSRIGSKIYFIYLCLFLAQSGLSEGTQGHKNFPYSIWALVVCGFLSSWGMGSAVALRHVGS